MPLEYETRIFKDSTKKVFKPTIDCLNKITKGGVFQITLEYSNSKKETEKNKFKLEIIQQKVAGLPFKITLPNLLDIGGVEYKESYGLTNELIIEQEGQKYFVSADSIKDFKTEFPRKPQYLEGTFLNFRSTNEEKEENFYRIVICVQDTQMIYPTEILEYDKNYMTFDISNWDKQKDLLGIPYPSTKGMYSNLEINGKKFHFYALEPINAFIIDCVDKIEKNDFIAITQSIRMCFAFIAGKFYKDETVYIASDDQDFRTIKNFDYKVEEPSIISENQIINPIFFFNQFSKNEGNVPETWKDYHKMFSCEVFSELCEKVLDSTELFRSLELVINAGAIKDPIQKGALYSVSLETITNYFKQKNNDNFKIVQDKKVWDHLSEDLKSIIAEKKDVIGMSDCERLINKIESINRIPNSDALRKPFDLVGITLTDEDIKVLEVRNRYLHGNKPNNSAIRFDLEAIALKLHCLICKLILKHISYAGHFMYLPAWYHMHNRETIKLFQKVDIKEIINIMEKFKNNELKDIPEKERLLRLIDDYKLYLKAVMEIGQLIMII
jgi:hypothetical protein